MKNTLLLTCIFIVAISCQYKKEDNSVAAYKGIYKISKGALGPIKVGSHISDYNLDTLHKVAVDAYTYHYGGGGNSFKYTYKDADVFVLMPARDTDSIIAIMALYPHFKTDAGLGPKMTVKDIIAQYKGAQISNDLLSGGEYIYDSVNKWYFVFETPEDKPIGNYKLADEPGTPVRLDAKCDWIEIK